ncbi:hypothetical protein DBV15_01639 [Temnothorax longispinosus]|uniref:Uncharacterized protein n=1 Tax=Temnothorax longispinosus TaxID=300112 RepID=A0A4S2L6K7_9HYME|nr:hypothetical protein DBV15_01639 [Temnothorax longispinosus]
MILSYGDSHWRLSRIFSKFTLSSRPSSCLASSKVPANAVQLGVGARPEAGEAVAALSVLARTQVGRGVHASIDRFSDRQ